MFTINNTFSLISPKRNIFLAVKSHICFEKKKETFLYQNLKNVWKKSKGIGLSTFKGVCSDHFFDPTPLSKIKFRVLIP